MATTVGTPATTVSPPSKAEPLHGRKAVALVSTLVLGVLAFQLGASMVTPALPEMARSLNEDPANIAQVSSIFFLSGAVAGVVLSRWSDFIGRRKMLMIILGVLALGTLLCIFAPSLPILLVGRVLQGACSATFQLAYVILSEKMSAKVFGTTLGIVTAVNGGVGGVDGYIGGLMSDTLGFRSIFVVILVVGLIALLCVALVLPKEDKPAVTGKMDWWGAATLSVALICLTYFVSHGSTVGWLAPSSLAFLGAALAAFVMFWNVEKRRSNPLIAVHHLRSRQVWPVVLTTTLTLASVFAVINFTVVLLSQNTGIGFGLSAATAALLFLLPPALIGVFSAPLAGWIAGRKGWLLAVRIGMIVSLVAVGLIALAPMNQWLVFAAVAVLGVSYNGFLLTTANGLGVILSPVEAPSALPGINGAGFGIGVGLGIGIVAPFAAAGTLEGYTTALWISFGILFLAFLSSLFIKGRPGQKI